jgi:hypothetical protein
MGTAIEVSGLTKYYGDLLEESPRAKGGGFSFEQFSGIISVKYEPRGRRSFSNE